MSWSMQEPRSKESQDRNSEIKLGFLVNTQFRKEGNVAQQLHLLVVRILLHFCFARKDVQWGYHLFRSGRLDITYKKILLQNISVKGAQKLLTDLTNNINDPRGAATNNDDKSLVQSWEEVFTLVLSDFTWEEGSQNLLFILSSSLPGESSKLKSIVSRLKKDKKADVIFVDTNYLEGSNNVIDADSLGSLLDIPTRIIPTDVLGSSLSHLWFSQILRWHLSTEQTAPVSLPVTFHKHGMITTVSDDNIITIDDDTKDTAMVFRITPLVGNTTPPPAFRSLRFKQRVSFAICDRFLSHLQCFFVVFDERYRQSAISGPYSFLVEEDGGDGGHSTFYLIKHLDKSCGIMFSLADQGFADHILRMPYVAEEPFSDLVSLHQTVANEKTLRSYALSHGLRENKDELKHHDELMHEIYEFHKLQISESRCPVIEQAAAEPAPDPGLPGLPGLPGSAREEAMSQGSPRYYQREKMQQLLLKYPNFKTELSSPNELKNSHQFDKAALIKEHKIQVVMHLIWYCEYSTAREEDAEETKSSLLALLRSLSFLTSPNDMFSFLSDQVVEEFHTDCNDLLRELYEDGFLMEAPDLLCSDSLSSSVLSVQGVQAPLYCEDSSSMSNDQQPITSSSSFVRQRSWMDPNQLSQSSFSIAVPKSKKRKKRKKERTEIGPVKVTSSMFNKQKPLEQGQPGQQRCRYLSAEITPEEMKQSSKRRKLTRKNSVLDTPLKKQVKNPTTAKTSRARQRVDVTPQKCTASVVQIMESPVRSGPASSFFGSQIQPARSFVSKDGFKTPNIPSLSRASSSEDLSSLGARGSPQHSISPRSSRSPHTFTPPGNRRFVKKLSYNSPMRALFATANSPKRKPLDNDFIQMRASPSLDKENEPFFPTFKSFDEPKGREKSHEIQTNTLEPIFREREISEDAQMPTFKAQSGEGGSLNLQSSGGFLKLLEDSSLTSFIDRKCESDNESDVSTVSSQYKSILKSPFRRTAVRKQRNVSFSLDADMHLSSSDAESDGICNLINLVDDSIKNDVILSADIFVSDHHDLPANKQNSDPINPVGSCEPSDPTVECAPE